MNLYYYWFSIVFGFCNSLSNDPHADAIAIALFSLIVSFLILGITALIIIFLGVQYILFYNAIPFLSIGLGTYILNIVLFGRKKRQERLMTEFKLNQSLIKDTVAITLTALSVVAFILAVVLNGKIQ